MSKLFNITIITFLGLCLTSVSAIKARAAEPDAGTLKFSTGLDYSSGDYGLTTDTDILYVPFSLEYETLPWRFKATVPYVRITGPEGVVAGTDGGIVIGPSSTKRSTSQGLGDVVLSTSYALDTVLDTSVFLDVTAKAKLATADEDKGLGTGANDYSLQLDVAKTYGKLTPFATVGHKIMGDPTGVELDNVWFGSLGGDYKLSDSLSTGLSYDFREASSALSDDIQEGLGYVNWKMNKSTSIMGYGVVGFSDGSPDSGIGVQLSYKY